MPTTESNATSEGAGDSPFRLLTGDVSEASLALGMQAVELLLQTPTTAAPLSGRR
jgi:hypothetical protein